MTGSHDEPTPKIDPEDLAIRAKPRPVTRINRRMLYLLSGTGLLLIAGATLFALDPPNLFKRGETGRELYNVDNKSTPEGLEGLPRRYSDLREPVPQLGPPLSGDLGNAVVQRERDLGIDPSTQLPFRPSPEDDAARAERIRQARMTQQGRESGVFFQLNMQVADAAFPSENETQRQIVPTPMPTGIDQLDGTYGTQLNIDLQNDQNLQARKIDFAGQKVDADIYNPFTLQDPVSPYQVMAGTIIAASMVTGVNSDLPGRVIAQVTENVFDSVTGNYLLIPQGSRVIGTYDSVIAFGQERALIAWQRIIMPDGSSVVIENLPATDTAGYSGLSDEVDFHTWQLLSGIALSTLLGVSSELTLGDQESDLVAAIRESTQKNADKVGQDLVERNLNIQPTLTIRPGWPLRIIVNKDMVLRPYRG